jgi:hypothetical protein
MPKILLDGVTLAAFRVLIHIISEPGLVGYNGFFVRLF